MDRYTYGKIAAPQQGWKDRWTPSPPTSRGTSLRVSPHPRRAGHHHAVIIRRGGKVLLEQRSGRGLWSAMWQMPTIEATRALRPGEVESRLALTVTGLERCTAFEHATTHRRIRFHVFAAKSRVRRGTWREPADAEDLPMSNPQRRILKMV